MKYNNVRLVRRISYEDYNNVRMSFRQGQEFKTGLFIKEIREEFNVDTSNHITRIFLGNKRNEAAEWKRIVNGKLVLEYDIERILL